jgi:predicted KAP-like P-loop ATPase
MSLNCQTPVVIGVHGDWGSGKTTLMSLTQQLLETQGVKTFWYNPWMYQFDDSPIIPLLNEIKNSAVKYKVDIKKLRL